MAPKKNISMSPKIRRILREYKVTNSYLKIAMAERALFLAKANLMLMQNNNKKFKASFCVNIPLFHAMTKSFEKYLEEVKTAIEKEIPIEADVVTSYNAFRKIIYTKDGAPRLRYTPRVALLVLLSFFSGRFSKVHIAIECGFKSAGTLRNATAHLLAKALQSSDPIKVRLITHL